MSDIPPGRTKQDVVNLVDIALSDSLVDIGPGGQRFDYDIFVEKLRGNGLCIRALSPPVGERERALEEAAKVAERAISADRGACHHMAEVPDASAAADRTAGVHARGRVDRDAILPVVHRGRTVARFGFGASARFGVAARRGQR